MRHLDCAITSLLMSSELQNIFIRIEYDGAPFAGWQRQTGKPTVQGEIETLLREFTGTKVVLYGASRTDSGVHARGQAANFYVPKRMEADRWAYFLNSGLPYSIRILSSRLVPPAFHAQKKAVSKLYEYRLIHRNSRSALDKISAFHIKPLNWDEIRRAMPYFVGTHDFKSFQTAGGTVKTTIRTVTRFELFEEGPGIKRFEIEGKGFLKQMVRNIIGLLLEIGEGKRKVEEIPAIFKAKDRRAAGRTADAEGLCLVRVNYEGEEFAPLS